MSIKQLNFEGKNKVEVAIMRLQSFEPPEGYYLAFSGGKDSVTIHHLATRAGVKFDAHYNLTGVDPPELVQFIKRLFPDVIIDKPKETIWQGLMKHGLPTRQRRWCCKLLKEHSGDNRRVMLGIRWAESVRRRTRPMFEFCQDSVGKSYLSPIIDWSNAEVWEYIKTYNVAYCSLYDEGFKRLGCVLCPMAGAKLSAYEIERFPKTAEAWRRAARRFYDSTSQRGIKLTFKSFDDLWDWWISRRGQKIDNSQCYMFNDN